MVSSTKVGQEKITKKTPNGRTRRYLARAVEVEGNLELRLEEAKKMARYNVCFTSKLSAVSAPE